MSERIGYLIPSGDFFVVNCPDCPTNTETPVYRETLAWPPSEQSSGGQRIQGPITKTGNTHARRLLVEAAWHNREPYRPSQALLGRQAGQPAVVRQRAERGNHRLHCCADRAELIATAQVGSIRVRRHLELLRSLLARTGLTL